MFAETEYVSTAHCCSQLLWIKNELEHYNVHETNSPVICDNSLQLVYLKIIFLTLKQNILKLNMISYVIMFEKE